MKIKNKPPKPKRDSAIQIIEKYLNTNYKGLPKNVAMSDLVEYFNFDEEYKKEFLERKKIVPDLANMIDSDIRAIERKHTEIALRYKKKEAYSADDWFYFTAYAAITNGQNFPVINFFSSYLKIAKIDAIKLEDSHIKAIAKGASDAYCLAFLKKELANVENKKDDDILINQKINQQHLIRGLLQILTSVGGADNRTKIAEFSYYLMTGKEPKIKKDYQSLLNAITANNKQPNINTTRKEKEIINKYLTTLNLPKEEK